MTDARHIARQLAKRWTQPEDPMLKNFVSSLRAVVGPSSSGQQPFTGKFWGSKHGYHPTVRANPGSRLQPQITRALGRARKTPKEVQALVNQTERKVVGTTTVASGPKPVGYGGSGYTGTKSYVLGQSSTAGQSTIVAPPPAPRLAPSTTPNPAIAAQIAPPGGNQA